MRYHSRRGDGDGDAHLQRAPGGETPAGAGDGARQAERGGVADLCQVGVAGGRALPGAEREHQIAVARRMGGHDGAGDAVMRGDGEAVALRLGQGAVGSDDGDGGIGARAEQRPAFRRVERRGAGPRAAIASAIIPPRLCPATATGPSAR